MTACDRKMGDGVTPCPDPARYTMGFTFEAVGGSPPVVDKSGLKVCEYHRKYANVSDLVDARMLEQIQEMLRASHLAPADPASLKLRFEALA